MKAFPWREQLIQLDDLTPAQLEQGAADLRNAAYVVDTVGYTTRFLVNAMTGAVCATGAIDLATGGRWLTKRTRVRPIHGGSDGYFALIPRDLDGDQDRPRRAYALLADFLPTKLCDGCDYDKPCDCQFPAVQHVRHFTSAWERVVHYNDLHCTSGELLSNMLVIAAERAEILAADARKLLTGKALV